MEGGADWARAKENCFGLLAQTTVGQTGTFHHRPDNAPSIPHPGGLLFSPPASCHHLGIESNDSRVYFSVSKKDRRREGERQTGVIRSGPGVSPGHRKPGRYRCLTKAFHLLQLSWTSKCRRLLSAELIMKPLLFQQEIWGLLSKLYAPAFNINKRKTGN